MEIPPLPVEESSLYIVLHDFSINGFHLFDMLLEFLDQVTGKMEKNISNLHISKHIHKQHIFRLISMALYIHFTMEVILPWRFYS